MQLDCSDAQAHALHATPTHSNLVVLGARYVQDYDLNGWRDIISFRESMYID